MALLWFDGFDHYRSTDGEVTTAGGVYTIQSSSRMGSVSTGFNGRGLQGTGLSQGEVRGPTFTFTGRSLVGAGCRYRKDGTSTGVPGPILYRAGSSTVFAVWTANDGAIFIQQGSNGSILETTGTGEITAGDWVHFEVRAEITGANTDVEVRYNGATILTTTFAHSTPFTAVSFSNKRNSGLSALTGNCTIDDIYVWDGSGDVNNSWLGERSVYTLLPDGDGSLTDWDLSTGSDGYALINQVPPDPDNDYLEAENLNLESDFTVSDLPTHDLSILGLNVLVYAEKTGTNATGIEAAVVSNSVEADSNLHVLVQDTPQYFNTIVEKDPDTDDSWSPGAVDEISFLVRRVL